MSLSKQAFPAADLAASGLPRYSAGYLWSTDRPDSGLYRPEDEVDGSAKLDEQRSAALSRALADAGFDTNRMRSHAVFTEVLEAIWAKFGFVFTGNFTEGWGYNLYAVNGKPGFDSSVTYAYILPGHTVHYGDCQCPDRTQLTCHVSKNTELLTLTASAIPVLRQMGLLVNIDGESVNPMKMSAEVNQKMVLSRSSANPEVHFKELLTCCPNYTRRTLESLQLPRSLCDGLDRSVRINLRPRPLLVSLLHQHQQSEPTADPDFSSLERGLFQRLSNHQGRLYMLIKYLLLEVLPHVIQPEHVRPFSEIHCRQLLWYMLSQSQAGGEQHHLIVWARQGLKLMAKLLEDHGHSRSAAMRNFFDRRQLVAFEEAAVDTVDRGFLCRILAGGSRLLAGHVDAYVARLQESAGRLKLKLN